MSPTNPQRFSRLGRRQWSTLVGAWLLGFAMWGVLLSVAPALLTISQELGLAFTEMGLMFSVPVLLLAALAPAGGFLADRVGPRLVGTLGALVMGGGSLLRGLAFDFPTLVLSSAVFGVGWGLALPTLPKTVGGWFEKRLVGSATGLYSVGIYAGAGLATAFVFFGHWRIAEAAWGVIAMGAGAAWWALVRNPPQASRPAAPSARLFSFRQIWILTVIFFFGANVTFYTLTGWLPTILAALGSPNAPLVASLLSFLAAPATLLIPAVSDRVGRRKPFLWGFSALGAAASYALFTAPSFLQPLAVALLGIAISAIFVVCFILPIELVPEHLVGSATGIMLVGYVGGIVGPWLAGYTRDLTGSFTPTMALLVVGFLVATILSFALTETAQRRSK